MRWHSPPDWTEADESIEGDDFFDGAEASSRRGLLSKRMQKEGFASAFLHNYHSLKQLF